MTRAAVNDNHTVIRTGAVDKYFKKLLSIILYVGYDFYISEEIQLSHLLGRLNYRL
jgi:hypothetical protein